MPPYVFKITSPLIYLELYSSKETELWLIRKLIQCRLWRNLRISINLRHWSLSSPKWTPPHYSKPFKSTFPSITSLVFVVWMRWVVICNPLVKLYRSVLLPRQNIDLLSIVSTKATPTIRMPSAKVAPKIWIFNKIMISTSVIIKIINMITIIINNVTNINSNVSIYCFFAWRLTLFNSIQFNSIQFNSIILLPIIAIINKSIITARPRASPKKTHFLWDGASSM